MHEDRLKLIDRIRKLMALSENNTNESEAISAALKAQKLIADNDVTKSELYEHCAQEVIEVSTDVFSHHGRKWRGVLADVVSSNFRCKAYTSRVWDGCFSRRARGQMIVFIGYDSDANAALIVFEKLVRIAERKAADKAREARRLGFPTAGVKNSYLLGFCSGVKGELEKQSKALLIVTPSEVEEAYHELDLRRNTWRPGSYDSHIAENGRLDGRDAIRSGRIEASDSSLLLTS